MKTKVNGLEATEASIQEVFRWAGNNVFYWRLKVNGSRQFKSSVPYTTRRGARKGLNTFAEKLEISMESVEVVE